MTADHGHVVERRAGTQRSYDDLSSARSRAAGSPAGEDEVLVAGARVLAHDGKAILAVDEGLRYGPLKAGYHGGASPAEVVVPLSVLVPEGSMSGDEALAGWDLAPHQEPLWWSLASAIRQPVLATPSPKGKKTHNDVPDLFSELTDESDEPTAAESTTSLGSRIVAAPMYASQRKIAGRVILGHQQVETIVNVVSAAVGSRLPLEAAAVALGVPTSRMPGAVAQLQKLLNVEGYPVLRLDGGLLVLDEALLREQFEVPA